MVWSQSVGSGETEGFGLLL